jgi:DNA topoisomerase-1
MAENLAARAKRHGLLYVQASELPVTRRKSGRGWAYFDVKGRQITKRSVIDRFNALVIPPAWQEVRIADDPHAHIQAIGRDSEGRLQYRYHDEWTGLRDKIKAERLLRFGAALPKIRERILKDLHRRKTDRRYAAAAAARLIDRALLRSGHSVGAVEDGGRGAATLLNQDVRLNGTKVSLKFVGKGGKTVKKTFRDPILLSRLRKLRRIGRERLFGFRDENGRGCYLTARDLNRYLREAAGTSVTAKDFRTFAASAHAIAALCEADCAPTESARKRFVADVMKETSKRLANTPAITRSSYVHPVLVEAFHGEALEPGILKGSNRSGLDAAETALMRFLEAAAAPPPPAAAGRRNTRQPRRVTSRTKSGEKSRWSRKTSTRSGSSSTAITSA